MRKLAFFLLIVVAACGRSDPPAPEAAATPPAAEAPAGGSAGAGQAAGSGLLVLVPEEIARQEISGGPAMILDDNHYAVARREDDLSWSLTGSVMNRAESSIDAAPQTPAATLRGVPIYVSENEGIKSATWIENGTAFALDVECASNNDPRCTSPDYILDRVRRLVEKPTP